MNKFLITASVVLLGLVGQAAPIDLNKGDHIVLLGNGLAERMQHHGWLESYIQAALPKHKLVFRNHGFSGDRINKRPRNKGFIDADTYLEISQADIILALFGYNESYDDKPEEYKAELIKWVDETLTKKYNGESAPKIILCSPIAHEDLNNPNLPDGRANNARIAKYARATAEAAQEKGIPYVDL